MAKKSAQPIRPMDPDEPMMIVCGWFPRDPPHDFVGVHQRLVRVVAPLRCEDNHAWISWTENESPDSPSTHCPRCEERTISVADWLATVAPLTSNKAIEHMYFQSDAYKVKLDLTPLEQSEACVPPYSYLEVYDSPDRLRVPDYDIAAAARDAVKALDADGQCLHAIVDYDYAGGPLDYGYTYTVYPSEGKGWHGWVEWYDWSHKDARQVDRLRAVCWGTYVGPRLAERLGKHFVEEYLNRRDDFYGAPQTAERLPGGGIYVTLTSTPRDMVECQKDWLSPKWIGIREMPIVQNAVWLRQRFRAAGIL
jgi:hypothetical protein